MDMNMGQVVYWHKDQVIIRIKSHPTKTVSNTFAGIIDNKLNPILAQAGLPQLKLPFDTILIRDPHHPENSEALHFAQIFSRFEGDPEIVISYGPQEPPYTIH